MTVEHTVGTDLRQGCAKFRSHSQFFFKTATGRYLEFWPKSYLWPPK